MTWWRLLGDEWVPEGLRGELWRSAHPELSERIAALLTELEAAGVDPGRWPVPRETAPAGPFQMQLMVLKATRGYEAVVAALEERWAADRRNPSRKRGPKRSALPGSSRDELELLATRLRDAGEPYGYDVLARRVGVSRSTVRRRLGLMK